MIVEKEMESHPCVEVGLVGGGIGAARRGDAAYPTQVRRHFFFLDRTNPQ
jgi:hypothetical protein